MGPAHGPEFWGLPEGGAAGKEGHPRCPPNPLGWWHRVEAGRLVGGRGWVCSGLAPPPSSIGIEAARGKSHPQKAGVSRNRVGRGDCPGQAGLHHGSARDFDCGLGKGTT